VKKGNGQRLAPFMAARWHGREKGKGVPGSVPRGGREAGKRGGPSMEGDNLGGQHRHRPLAGGRGRRCY
jgi:hypothetical protein